MLMVIPVLKHKQNQNKAQKIDEGGDAYQSAEVATAEAENLEIAKLIKAIKGEQERPAPGLFELFINQLIVTIEFVLCTVSNTASYLRLWALSLAHSCLASVFFNLTVGKGILAKNYYIIFFSFYVYMACTFGVLMCMDLLEGFLHTLRLHWVEFQSKFF